MKSETLIASVLARIEALGVLMDHIVDPRVRTCPDFPYPRVFRELIDHHLFGAFDIGGVRVFSNIRGEEDSFDDLVRDAGLISPLRDAGYSPFGRPDTGAYDPVCFDMRAATARVDAPVVLIEHESVLVGLRVPRPRAIAEGLLELFDSTSGKAELCDRG